MARGVRSAQEEIDRLLTREQQERAAAAAAPDKQSHDDHFMRAERYADRAWSLQEAHDLPYKASGLWLAGANAGWRKGGRVELRPGPGRRPKPAARRLMRGGASVADPRRR